MIGGQKVTVCNYDTVAGGKPMDNGKGDEKEEGNGEQKTHAK